ncbi:MAG: hypothetical protein M9896_19275 [Candidatus Promineofilum sp.]|uniref:hypothetical protein n=1 Tax=Promineifilum sp. TaxID=2664178 RepID=UPI002411BD57|nr:hypothetical protein [Promineifilum sp.]
MAVRIEGIREAQQGVLRTAEAATPRGAMPAAVKEGTLAAHRYAVSRTHVDTGALKASQVVDIRGNRGIVYLNPSARRSDGRRPAEYGVYEHQRGGSHAFYARTVQEDGRSILQTAGRAFRRYLP